MPQKIAGGPRSSSSALGRVPRGTRRSAVMLWSACGLAAGLAACLGGCETDSFLDPSVVGRWEHTPTRVPILTRLSAIEDATDEFVEYTEVTPDDLIPQPNEYRVGPGDRLQIVLYDDVNTNQPGVYERSIDIRGMVDLPQLGEVNLNNRTIEQAKELLRQALSKFVNDPLVLVVPIEARQQTYHVTGEVANPGPYFISRPDYRLLEGMTASGRWSEAVGEIYVIRQIALRDEVRGILPSTPSGVSTPTPPAPAGATTPAAAPTGSKPATEPAAQPEKVIDLIDELSQPKAAPAEAPKRQNPAAFGTIGAAPVPAEVPARARPTAVNTARPPSAQPPASEPPVDLIEPAGRAKGDAPPVPVPSPRPDGTNAGWVFLNGQWVQTNASGTAPMPGPSGGDPALLASQLMTQRVIRVPVKPLIAGDARYNIVIRPGDIIRVPSPTQGLVYVVGQVSRPGPYNLPEVGKMTLLRAIDSAGGFGSLAIPERVDLTRVVGTNMQATIRVDMRAINEGTMPDIYIKPDDRINVGTNFWAFPLAVFRNGLRASYGFGFVLDRNFANEIFGVQKTNIQGN